MKITSDLTKLTTAILILTVQMFIEWTLSNPEYPPVLLKNVLYCTMLSGVHLNFQSKLALKSRL
jgi:hypothetical protein